MSKYLYSIFNRQNESFHLQGDKVSFDLLCTKIDNLKTRMQHLKKVNKMIESDIIIQYDENGKETGKQVSAVFIVNNFLLAQIYFREHKEEEIQNETV